MIAARLKTNDLKNPVGIDPGRVVFRWIPEGGLYETAFRVTLETAGRSLFDSGKIRSSETEYPCPLPIPSRTEVRWSVTLWDENGLEGRKAFASFETGLSKEDWTACWIDPEEKHPELCKSAADGFPLNKASYLRKRFSAAAFEKARLYVTAHGIYDVYLNGAHVDGYFLAPGISDYERRLQVQTYDVGGLLREGENEILVTIGEGWRRGSYGYNMRRYAFGTDLALLCELRTDGETILRSDETWEASQDGPLRENDPMRLERFDARRGIENWHPVRVSDFGFGNLVGSGPPVTPHERFRARLFTAPNGGKVLDFGQNFAGYVELDVNAKGGEKIVLTHGEVLDADGNFQNDNFQNKSCPLCRQVVEYICKPGRNVYHRTKGYYGFRYVLLETDLPVTGAEFTGVAVYSDMEETAAFTCGNEAVNRLFRNTIWSMKSNFVDIPTDCPHREKLGFTGDCQVFSEAALYLMDCLPVLSRYLREAASSQFEDGMVPGIVPRSGGKLKPTGKDGSAGWSDAIVIVPYRILRMTDSVLSAEEWYPNMKKWVLCQLFRMKESRPENAALPPEIRDHILDTADNWGEWCEPGRTTAEYAAEGRETGHAELATAFTAQGCLYLSRIAGRLGKRDDEAFFRVEYEKIREAYRAVFTDHGRISSDRQCRYVRPVAHELLSTEESRIAVENLVRLIRSNGGAIGTGFLTTCYLNSVLTEYGFASAAYDLLLRKEQPSWLFEVEQGATTIWENWFGIREDGSRRGSHNHYAFGAVSAWLMKYVLGIGLSGGKLTLRPYPDRRLGFAEGSFLSPLGRIASSWRYEGEEIVFTFEVPPNCRAAAKLPGKETVSLEPGRHSFRIRASEKAE